VAKFLSQYSLNVIVVLDAAGDEQEFVVQMRYECRDSDDLDLRKPGTCTTPVTRGTTLGDIEAAIVTQAKTDEGIA